MANNDLLRDLAAWCAANQLALWVGLGVAGGVWGVMLLLRWRATARERLARAAEAAARQRQTPEEVMQKAIEWVGWEPSAGDRRSSLRRGGQAVPVKVAAPLFRGGLIDGYVIDRSTGGLCIALSCAVPTGTILKVRAVHAPDTVDFVNVIVRNCRQNKEIYEVGCEFEQTPPWNVLLLFG